MSGSGYKDWKVRLAFPSEVLRLGIVMARSEEEAIERAKENWERDVSDII